MRLRTIPGALAAMLLGALGAAGQVANPLAQAVGMGGNYTALARGLGAPAWNPAGLGMPDNPGFSIAVLPLDLTSGLDPISPADLADYDGERIPFDTRVRWLDRIRAEGAESGAFAGDVTYLALSTGPFALSVSSSARARADIAPDVAEVLLFGNAGLTGEPGDYTLERSSFDVAGTTTLAASYAVPLSLALGPLPDQHFALGMTLKYTVGNFLLHGQEEGSSLTSSPLAVDLHFPLVTSPMPDSGEGFRAEDLDNGSGVGVDVGAAWQGANVSAGVVIRNLVNTFEWDPDALEFRRGAAVWNADSSYASFEEAPIDEVPRQLVDRIDELYTFDPVLAAGAAVRALPVLTLTADIRHALGENLDVGTRDHAGVGLEVSALPVLPVRAGIALISGGYRLAGGLGIRLGAFQLAAAATRRETDLGSDGGLALGATLGLP